MAKVPGPYAPLTRALDDPPPYSEVQSSTPSLLPVGATAPNLGYLTDDDGVFRTRRHSNSTNRTSGSGIEPGFEPIPPVVTRGVPLASKSIDVVCPHCQTSIRTSIEKRPGIMAYLSGAIMACLCCFCGCCLIPCCIEECMEVKHTCPNCDGLIGKYRL
ncbi:Cell death-inducing p53-target protein 1 [Orchesella cincta]|uniref:Cell death-inducing p53-target protein 1 n=1 Tax=Orchesella cincta TaxID=48709 RepID=A0A1D2NHT1_ORCCI|nr:Cell death-inducing p53-target protein 1 [Orchesella cincta]